MPCLHLKRDPLDDQPSLPLHAKAYHHLLAAETPDAPDRLRLMATAQVRKQEDGRGNRERHGPISMRQR